MARNIYLDHNATTPPDEEVIEAMLPFLRMEYGNPSSPHLMGKHAYAACTAAREKVGSLLGCSATEIVFTSGATESNNLVLLGFLAGLSGRTKIVTSKVEHKSILEPCKELRRKGMQVVELPVSTDCVVDLDAAAETIDENTALVTVQAANNEVGVLQPIEQIADIAHSKGALFHCDAAQLVGKMPLPNDLKFCDYLSMSAHKLYGPKGIGVLLIRNGVPRRCLGPILRGGGQEDGLRPGTLNVPSIVGLGYACEIIQRRLGEDVEKQTLLRDRFETALIKALPMSWSNGMRVARLPGTCSLTIPGVSATMLIANLPTLCIGEGSACASGALEPSHVLMAMGLSRSNAECTVRISYGRQNTLEDAVDAASILSKAAIQILEGMSFPSPTQH